MNKGTLIGLAVMGFIVLLVASLIGWWFGIVNGEIALGRRYDAQFNVVETTIDMMRKTIMNQHTCTKEWADAFIAVVAQQAKGRTGQSGQTDKPMPPTAAVAAVAAGGTAFQIGRESEALGIPPTLFTQLANSIEGKLAELKRAQDVLTDVWREHTTYCQTYPNCWFVASKVRPRPEMITSVATKDAMEKKVIDDNLMR